MFHSPWPAHNVCSFHCVYRLCNGACIRQTHIQKFTLIMALPALLCKTWSFVFLWAPFSQCQPENLRTNDNDSHLHQTHKWGVCGNVTYKNIPSLLLNLWTFTLTLNPQPIMNWVLCSPVPLSVLPQSKDRDNTQELNGFSGQKQFAAPIVNSNNSLRILELFSRWWE